MHVSFFPKSGLYFLASQEVLVEDAMADTDLDATASQVLMREAQTLLTPSQFTRCLTEAGLGDHATRLDFVQNPGPIAQEKLRRFFRAIHERCGEAVYRLFTHNLGYASGHAACTIPDISQLQAQYGKPSAAPNLGQALGAVVARMQGRGAMLMLPVADPIVADTWHITVDPCYYCVGLTARAPICAMYPGFLHEVLGWVTNIRVVTKEIACRACGQDACVILIARAI